jgi:hypothetical protein
VAFAAALTAAVAAACPSAASAGELKAGAAAVDASWHVGASAGQYASDGAAIDPANGNYDPTLHQTRRAASYGIQSRLQARAIVLEGPGGNRMAIVKNDLYIPQDLLWRRTAQLLEAGDSGIGRQNLTIASSHNHSSPYYSSTAWGAWAFQDVFDVRFYNYYAQQMAEAVEQAVAGLVPVRVGASVSSFDKTPRHSFGPAIATDGSPAGYPHADTDHDLTVVRFDDVSDPANPKPLANLVNFALHPEFLDGNDLISEDYLAPLEKMTDRATGAVTIWTQGAVGTAEPERSSYHSIHERLEFTHREYAQAEYGARLMSNAIVDTWRDIERGTPEREGLYVPFDADFADAEVAFQDRWFPGPITHPYPGVSNCRTDEALAGNPQIPIIGLPDCQGIDTGLGTLTDLLGLPEPPDAIPGADPGLTTDDFQRLGIPVPENYSAPAYTGLEEDIDVHLQAFRIGGILFTACSCEQWADQSRNIRTRTDRVAGNEHLGYDWKAACDQNGDGTYGGGAEGYGTGTWTCPNPNNTAQDLPPLSDQVVERMHRQVTNPANGWNEPSYALQADSEPTDLRQIKGNYTHDDDAASAALGYDLTVPLGMTNDYNGYIATYREYQRGDHYRKALTGWGPHSSDYFATRLVNMGRVLNGGSAAGLLPPEIGDGKVPADLAVNDARAQALGAAGTAAAAAYEAKLPDDGGIAEPVVQPQAVERFDGTFFTWNGGSNYTDNPRVKVQREVGGQWQDYAGQAGEIPVTVQYPQGTDAPSYETGSFQWHWTAHFEAFSARFETVEGNRSTPAGRYRFVVDGERRQGHARVPYHLESLPFEVQPWDGITVEDMRVESDGTVSFKVGPRNTRTEGPVTAEIGPIDYPDSYDYGGAGELPRFIGTNIRGLRDPAAPNDPALVEWFCDECAFRPWLDFGDAETATVTFASLDGSSRQVTAVRQGGRWRTSAALAGFESALVGRGCVRDVHGNFNGAVSARVPTGGFAVDASCALPGEGAGAGGGGADAGCPAATGRVRGPRLGRARLGGRRARHRRLLPGLRRPRRFVDRFCHADGGLTRIGYPSPKLTRFLAPAMRRRLRGRAVLILTTSTHYSLRGLRPGARVRALGAAVAKRRRFKVGANVWHVAAGRRSALLFKVRGGRIREVGVADGRLMRGRLAARRFLRSFS